MIVTQVCQELGAGCCRRGLGIGRRESVVGHGVVVVQGVDVGGVSGRQEYRRRIVDRGGRNLDEGRRRSPKKITWSKISKARERDALSAIDDEDLGFGEEAGAGEYIDQVLAGKSWNVRRTKLTGTRDGVDESEIA